MQEQLAINQSKTFCIPGIGAISKFEMHFCQVPRGCNDWHSWCDMTSSTSLTCKKLPLLRKTLKHSEVLLSNKDSGSIISCSIVLAVVLGVELAFW